MCDLKRSSVACTCGAWSLRIMPGCGIHSGDRANHLIDSWLRHAAEESAKAKTLASGE